MIVFENQWGYYKDWLLSYVKILIEVIDCIVYVVLMGGNMVVNFGFQFDGDFCLEEKELVMVLGCWMKRYGECIYGCDYVGWDKQDWGYYICKG